MKSLAELQAIRDKMKNAINVREGDGDKIRVVVGMATCGIAAGANVSVSQTGCIGICQYEPVVEVFTPDGNKTTYVKMTAEKAVRVVTDHLVNGNVVSEYTIGSVAK